MLYLTALVLNAPAVELPNLAEGYGPPGTWDGTVFQLSKDYPTQLPTEPQPWKSVDPIEQDPAGYLNAVITYCFEGNLDAHSAEPAHFDEQFPVATKPGRKWFHAPWMQIGRHPREFVHGMTDERTSKVKELAASQTSAAHNFAVGYYNPVGAFTFHNVWSPAGQPDQSDTQFAEGTVAFKLLFTDATDAAVPWLKEAPAWHADAPRGSHPANLASAATLRLLQVDVAVRDSRSKCGGWVFGTFHYDFALAAEKPNPWERLRPLSLMWGNDEGFKQSDYDHGQRPTASWINRASPIAQYRSSAASPVKVFGWAGRANGPVDNPISSCLSCHSTAQLTPQNVPPLALVPPNAATEQERLAWFKDLASGAPLTPGANAIDFSLQLTTGLVNYHAAHTAPPVPGAPHALSAQEVKKVPVISRSGDEE